MREITCPYCGGNDVTCEYVDIGVGMIPCTPYGCNDCHAYQLGYNERKTENERRTGWAEPDPAMFDLATMRILPSPTAGGKDER